MQFQNEISLPNQMFNHTDNTLNILLIDNEEDVKRKFVFF